jgi:hypothetical protein
MEERRKVREKVVSLQSLMSQTASSGNEDLNKEYLYSITGRTQY